MNILYIANARIPTEKAHGVNIMQMCASFAELGHTVVLMVPKRKGTGTSKNPWDYYGILETFSITFVPIFDAISRGLPWGYACVQCFFSLSLLWKALPYKRTFVIYTRDEYSGLLLRLLGYRVFYDMHGFPERHKWFWRLAMRAMKGITVTNQWKMKQLKEQFHIQDNRMLCVPNGFTPSMFLLARDKYRDVRQALHISSSTPIALYAGQLYDWKGANVFAEAAITLPHVVCLFIGGTEPQLSLFRQKYAAYKNIIFLPRCEPTEVGKYLLAADVLVLPNSAQSAFDRLAVYSTFDTSPIKMFEYMASGRPIVASHLPSIREILTEDTAYFAEPDDSDSFANAILYVLKHKSEAAARAYTAQQYVQQFTWKHRAERIVAFMKDLMNL